VALVGALGPPLHDREMRPRKGRTDPSPPTQQPPADVAVEPHAAKSADGAAKKSAVSSAASKPKSPGEKAPSSKRSSPARKRAAASALEQTIGYSFKDDDLLVRALTHISALAGGSRTGSYQRLEFLGDHVLGLVISDMLFRAFPRGDEGELSRRLADLVRRESCADVARSINLGDALRLGASESNAGGRARTAILADVCEALVGAVFLDGGYAEAAALVERLWGDRMRAPTRPLRDPKTMLQEWAQARGLPTPTYKEVERIGPHHSPEFRIAVSLPQREPAEGRGRSKRVAEQAAAAAMLQREGMQAERNDG
jgi:ribonuclease-3